MQTLQAAVAQIRELENEEVDLVAGGLGYTASSETSQTATNSPRTIAAYGQLQVVVVQDDMNTDTSTTYSFDW